MGDEGNGQGKSRLDRLEGLMQLLIEDHLKFRDDLRQLLTAQVLLTDRVDKLAITVQELAESQKHTDDRLNALIHVVDDWITRGIPPPPRQ
jgi:hypothetical protein